MTREEEGRVAGEGVTETSQEPMGETGKLEVLTGDLTSQWSDSLLSKRVKSLMKTAIALRMKEMKRCMWM